MQWGLKMAKSYPWLAKLLRGAFQIWLVLTAFFAFITFAACGYNIQATWRALLDVEAGWCGQPSPRLPTGIASSIQGWVFFTILVTSITAVTVIILQWRLTTVSARLGTNLEPQEECEPERTDMYAPKSQVPPLTAGFGDQSWSGLAMTCVILAAGSLGLYMASFFGVVLPRPVYAVPIGIAFVLTVILGLRAPSISWLGRFMAVPLWLRAAVVVVGVGMAVVCARSAYMSLTNPTLYNHAIGSANLALVGAFFFLVDALAFWTR